MKRASIILKQISEMGVRKVIAHISGPSGSGKTELVNILQSRVKNIHLVDLDQFDDEAIESLGWTNIPKNDYSEKMLDTLHKKRQGLIDRFIRQSSKPIIFFGHTTEAGRETHLPAHTRILLSTSPKKAAVRRGKAQKLSPQELLNLIKVGKEDVSFFRGKGYVPMTSREIYNQILVWSKEL